MAYNGHEPFYILSFVAHKPARRGGGEMQRVTFAATLQTESEREQRALKWLRQDLSDTKKEEEDTSEEDNDSTCARMLC